MKTLSLRKSQTLLRSTNGRLGTGFLQHKPKELLNELRIVLRLFTPKTLPSPTVVICEGCVMQLDV
jgi:hypothetical protein